MCPTHRSNLSTSMVMALAILLLLLFQIREPTAACKQYTVGDTVWSIPSFPSFYANWSSAITFSIGDSLLFEFEPEFHNVVQVPRLDYGSCTANNPIKFFNVAPAIVSLIDPGAFYFICNVSNYCELGQKVSVTVQGQPTGGPSPSPSPSINSSVPSSSPPFPSREAPSPAPVGGDADVLPPSSKGGNSSEAPNAGSEHAMRMKPAFGFSSAGMILIPVWLLYYFVL